MVVSGMVLSSQHRLPGENSGEELRCKVDVGRVTHLILLNEIVKIKNVLLGVLNEFLRWSSPLRLEESLRD